MTTLTELILVPNNTSLEMFTGNDRGWERVELVPEDYFHAFLQFVKNPSTPWDAVEEKRPGVSYLYSTYTTTVMLRGTPEYKETSVSRLWTHESKMRNFMVVQREVTERDIPPAIGIIPTMTTVFQQWSFTKGQYTIRLRQLARGKTKQTATQSPIRYEITVRMVHDECKQPCERVLSTLVSYMLSAFDEGRPVDIGTVVRPWSNQ